MRLLFFNLFLSFALVSPKLPPLQYLCYYNFSKDETFTNYFKEFEFNTRIDSIHLDNCSDTLNNQSLPIMGSLKNTLIRWISKISSLSGTAELYYIGSVNKTENQRFHFVYTFENENNQYVHVLVEYNKQIRSIIEIEHSIIFTYSEKWTARLIQMSRKRIVVNYRNEVFDMMTDEEFPKDEEWKQVIKINKGVATLKKKKL